ncbi:MAG TPA: LytTR family transcriptional regulator [Lutibacter sp.]|nr:LytTR family transcriptional regulator [Lutibacter sp.]
MNEYLNKPFPFIENKKHRILASFLFSGFIYVFLLTFQPFGISNILYYKPIFILGFFGITFIVLLFSFLVAPAILKNQFDFDKWTIKKNATFIVAQFLIITVLNWIYNSSIGREITEQHSLLFFIFITVTVGIIPTLFLVYFIEKKLANKNEHFATNFTKSIQQKTSISENTRIKILSKNNDETIIIDLKQLLCVKSEGNYLKVFFLKENIIKSKLIRNSFSKIEEQLVVFEKVKRCHRSYIVNLDKVEKMTGNARNLNLHISNLDFTIPVSRSFPKEVFIDLNI